MVAALLIPALDTSTSNWELLCYLVNSVGIEGDMSLDLRNRRIRILIRPHGIDGLLSSSWNAVVIAVAFIRAVGGVIGPFQLGEIDVFTGNVLNGRIVRFAKCQGLASIGNHAACDGDDNASRIALDRNRMLGTRYLNLFLFHVSSFVLTATLGYFFSIFASIF